jgi:CUB domain
MSKYFAILFMFYFGLIVFLDAQFAMPAGNVISSVNACAGTFTDQNASGNYSSNQNSTLTICPTVAGQYVSVTFTSFDTESGSDFLRIFNGNTGTAGAIASLSGTAIPGTYTSSNASGCLTFRFRSDNSTNRPGWVATISCSATPGPDPVNPAAQDCGFGGGTTVCNDAGFSGNSGGSGANDFAFGGNDGCLSGENQSSWYYFSPSASGTLAFNIIPANGTDDYDFAIWGPTATLQCPAFSLLAPVRCSYAAGGGTTGLGNGATDNSEGSGGDRFVAPLNVIAGQFYVMLIDNFSATASPFTLDWTFTGGASLNCAVLPIELLYFKGELENGEVNLNWATASEKNNEKYNIERTQNGKDWELLQSIKGAGNSSTEIKYHYVDEDPIFGVSYYRLVQVDYDGKSTSSKVIVIDNSKARSIIAFPNPSRKDALKLQIHGFRNQEISMALKSLYGATILSKSLKVDSDNLIYDLPSNAAEGTYILSIQSNNYISVKKVIIQ